jgi:flagellar protein FlaG
MSTAVSPVAPVDPALAPRSPVGDLGTAAVAAREPAQDLRLIIEEDEATGAFIYKTYDRATGEMVQQLPREEVLRMRADETYAAGALVDAKA